MQRSEALVLIDQSLKGPGGHHYQYAKRILDAARDCGLDTILLAHHDYDGDSTHKVYPAFSRGFWENYEWTTVRNGIFDPDDQRSDTEENAAPQPWSDVEKKRLSKKRHIVFSKLGLCIERVKGKKLTTILFSDTEEEEKRHLIHSDLKTRIAAWFVYNSYSFFTYIKKNIWVSSTRRFIEFVCSPVLLAMTPAVVVFKRIKMRSNTAEKVFLNELQSISRKLTSPERAIFFVPNATSVEIQALMDLTSNESPLSKAHWVLLYRRPLFSGYPCTHPRQFGHAEVFKFDLARLKLQAPNLNVTFCTDTEELTTQYDTMGVYKFKTLPVPVDLITRGQQSQDISTMTIGYLGDVRDEKGFHHIKPVIEAINKNQQIASSVRFLLQSDFNIPGGETFSSRAVEELEAARFPNVELVYGPFDNVGYEALLAQIDFMLAPYNAENYCARSSGIFMEALCSGIPVAVPAGSWMANVVEKDRRQHFESEIADLKPTLAKNIGVDAQGRCNLDVPDGSGYISIRFALTNNAKTPIRVVARYLASNGQNVVAECSMVHTACAGNFFTILEKPASDRLNLRFETLGDLRSPNIDSIEVTVFTTEQKIKLNRGVIVFDDPRTLPNLITDAVIDFHYHREAIQKLQKQLEHRYKPLSLVEMIN